MQTSSTQPSEVQHFRQLGHQLIDLLADQIESVQQDTTIPILPYRDPEEELAFWQADFAKEDRNVLGFFQNVLDHSIKLHHPHYIGHQVSVPGLMSGLAGLMSDVLSNGTGVYEMGMASNALERVVTDFTAQAIGYGSGAGGILTSGGTLANLTALLAARQAKAPMVWGKGTSEKLAVLVSQEAHYCVDRAARIMGLGEEGVIKVPVDANFKIRLDVLPNYLQAAKDKGLKVIAMVGCAGSTATGSYDDLDALAEFCATNDLWLHVDGAHGGAVVFTEKYKGLTKGIERADTVVIDFHKMLLTPALNTALVYRDGRRAYETFAQRAQYLWEEQQSPEWYHSGKRTFECTKLMLSIKIYALLKAHGKGVFNRHVTHLYDKAARFADIIDAAPDFELAIAPAANIINFRYTAASGKQLDWLNTQLRDKVVKEGNFYIVQTVIDGKKYLRMTVMHPGTTDAMIGELLERLRNLREGTKG